MNDLLSTVEPTTVAALELEGVELHYGLVKALHGVDFHVRAGEVVALLGDNGAGKSTMLKVLSGAHKPSSGHIRVRGVNMVFDKPRDAATVGIQMVYQDLALVEARDIATNLCLGREILRTGPLGWLGFLDHRQMRREAQREIEVLGMKTASMTRPVELLSGGQRQVVALARAAVRVKDGDGVLLLDEPTAALGYEQTMQVEDLIRRLAKRRIGIVLVTHNFELAFSVADRIVVMNRGRKVADVPTSATDGSEVVGWVTGARAPQEGLTAPGLL